MLAYVNGTMAINFLFVKLILCMLGNFAQLFCHLQIFSKTLTNIYSGIPSVLNSLDPDQA